MVPRPPPPAQPASADDSDYLIQSALEIRFILRMVREKRALVTLHYSDNNETLFTSIVEVDCERGDLVLDYPAEEQACRGALAADAVICTTAHDEVKVQFRCEALRKIRHNGREHLCCNLPAAIVRVQRRNSYRVQTPHVNPLKCVIALPAGSKSPLAEVIVLDISCGGISVIDHHPLVAMDPGATYNKCRLDLPGVGEIAFRMQVKDTYPFTLRNGLTCRRAGCEFLDMPESTTAMVQRYIIQLERSRNANRGRLV